MFISGLQTFSFEACFVNMAAFDPRKKPSSLDQDFKQKTKTRAICLLIQQEL